MVGRWGGKIPPPPIFIQIHQPLVPSGQGLKDFEVTNRQRRLLCASVY